MVLSLPPSGNDERLLMRLSRLALPAATFAIAAVLAGFAASIAAQMVEDSSVVGVRQALDAERLTWADADADGLQLFVIGTAPSEAERFRALSVAGRVVDSARVIDQMSVEETAELAPPEFSIEILRNDAGISLFGLIPLVSDRDALMERVGRLASDDQIRDFLETGDYPAPERWAEALDFALFALKELPSSKISVSADRVAVTANTESLEDKREVEATLLRRVPDEVELALSLSAPRPVITPFTLRFSLDAERGPRLVACSAEDEATRERILKSARNAGIAGQAGCRIGLGQPSRNWGKAVELGIEAVTKLGGGTVTLSDTDMTLNALEGTEQALFDQVAGELEAQLPEVFALRANLPVAPEVEGNTGPVEFVAIRSPEGMVQLRGRVNGEMARRTAESFARAKFGSDTVYSAARVDDSLPGTWQVRVLAGLEALSFLQNGAVTVGPDNVRVYGNTGRETASDEIAGLLAEKLGDEAKFDIEVAYNAQLDPMAGKPSPEQCEEAIRVIVGERKINFEPGSATLDREGQGIMDDIAEVLKDCGAIRLEIQGHTDSQGREMMNQQLSQSRAQAVLNELRARRVLTSSFTAKGYGETRPIADNQTESGREANRRIEFRLIVPEPAEDSETTLESVEQTGQTGEAGDTSDDTGGETTEEASGGQD